MISATTPDEFVISLDHVSKLYRTVMGVNDITCDLQPGGYGLIGPNGAGKTTLLHLLVGVLCPTLGTVRVFGDDPHRHQQLLRRVGYCPAQDGMYGDCTAWQWVRYLLELHGVTPTAACERVEAVLVEVGMKDAMHRSMSTYSRGMRQRVKIAQAIAHDPKLLILDEPFNGLDPIARQDITDLLRNWIRQGQSLILASHVLHEVEAVTESFLLICGGRLLASGIAREVHQLLAGVPHEIRLECDDRQLLASELLRGRFADSVHLPDRSSELIVSTKVPLEFFQSLPRLQQQLQVKIHQLESMDDSLQSLFDKLFRIHRGEG